MRKKRLFWPTLALLFAGVLLLIKFASSIPTMPPAELSASLMPRFGGPYPIISAARTAELTHKNITDLTFTINNAGDTDCVLMLSATSSLPWIDVSKVLSPVALKANQSINLIISVTVPENIQAGTRGTLRLVVDSQPNTSGPSPYTIDLTVID